MWPGGLKTQYCVCENVGLIPALEKEKKSKERKSTCNLELALPVHCFASEDSTSQGLWGTKYLSLGNIIV